MRSVILALLALLANCSAQAAAPAGTASREEVRRMVVQEALRSDRVPASLALAVAQAESDFVADAVSSAGARGVMQIMPATARGEFGVAADELWNPRLNIQLGVAFLDGLIERYDGRWDLALSHYNGGSRVGSGKEARVIPATRAYVDKVLAAERRFAVDAAVRALADRVVEANATLSRPSAGRRPVTGPSGEETSPRQPRKPVIALADAVVATAVEPERFRPAAPGSQELLDRIADRKVRFRLLLGVG